MENIYNLLQAQETGQRGYITASAPKYCSQNSTYRVRTVWKRVYYLPPYHNRVADQSNPLHLMSTSRYTTTNLPASEKGILTCASNSLAYLLSVSFGSSLIGKVTVLVY